MAFKIFLTVFVSLIISACGPKETEYPAAKEVPGIYINMYRVDVIEANTGEVMGVRTVRDTIYIKRDGNEFEVINRKWLSNDYDGKGWVDSMQGEIEPVTTYHAKYDLETGSLLPSVETENKPPLFLKDDMLFWGELRALEYLKVTTEQNDTSGN